MKLVINDPPVGRLVVAVFDHQQNYPNSDAFERNFGLEKVERDLRAVAADALVQGEDERTLPSAADLRRELGDLRRQYPNVPERNVLYLAIMESLSGLTPTSALAAIERFKRLPVVVTEPNVAPASKS